MTIMTIRIPDDVKEAFDKAFEGQDKDAIIAQIIRDGLAVRATKVGHEAVPPQRRMVQQFRELRKGMPSISQDEIRPMREERRH